MNDHARGCQGREYTCTCGYDAQTNSPEQFEQAAESIASMVIEWVEGAERSELDWRGGLANIIQARLYRLLAHSKDPFTVRKV